MSLRLVSNEPSSGRIFGPTDIRGRAVRAGDRREPLQVNVDHGLARFLDVAATAGLEPSCAITLGLERALAIASCENAGYEPDAVEALLDDAAANARVEHMKNSQDARYLRQLCAGPRVQLPGVWGRPLALALPGRIIDRARALRRPWPLAPEHIDQMVVWEVAATTAGLTMTEWAALTVLAGR